MAIKKMMGDKIKIIDCLANLGMSWLMSITAISNAIKQVVNTIIVQMINKMESKRSKKIPGIDIIFESSNTG